jgi:hypothetical protein
MPYYRAIWASFLMVRSLVCFSRKLRPDNPRGPAPILLQQWIEIKEMLMESGACDTGILGI